MTTHQKFNIQAISEVNSQNKETIEKISSEQGSKGGGVPTLFHKQKTS